MFELLFLNSALKTGFCSGLLLEHRLATDGDLWVRSWEAGPGLPMRPGTGDVHHLAGPRWDRGADT